MSFCIVVFEGENKVKNKTNPTTSKTDIPPINIDARFFIAGTLCLLFLFMDTVFLLSCSILMLGLEILQTVPSNSLLQFMQNLFVSAFCQPHLLHSFILRFHLNDRLDHSDFFLSLFFESPKIECDFFKLFLLEESLVHSISYTLIHYYGFHIFYL